MLKEYIEKKIDAYKKISNPESHLSSLASSDSEISRLWKTECEKNNYNWSKISTNEDVIELIDRFEGQVHFVENNVPYGSGNIIDGYNMSLAEYHALQGLRKLAQFIDPHPWSKTEFKVLSKSEIDELFDRMEQIVKRMNEQNFRRAMQE